MLRTLKDLENCEIGATNGSIGQVNDFYFDDHDWASAPLYDASEELNRNLEIGLYKYYGRPGYWTDNRLYKTKVTA
jgi:hypothetical protein